MNFMITHSNDPTIREKFLTARNKFKYECRKAKRKNWKEFCSSISSPKNMAQFTKILNRTNLEHIGFLKTAEGNHVNCPQQNVDLLLSTRTLRTECAPSDAPK